MATSGNLCYLLGDQSKRMNGKDLLEFGKEIPQDIEISAIYATWALTLRCYAGMDTIHFKTFDSFRNGPDIFFQQSGCLQLKLNGNATVGDLIRTVEIYSTELNTSCNCNSYQQKYNVEFQEALSKTGIIVFRASKTEVRDSKESLQTGNNEPVCIILHVEIRNTGIALRLECMNHIYLDLAHKVFGSFTNTLCSLKDIVERPIRTVGMSSRNDRDQVNQWNISDLTRVDVCLHNQVESQCRAHPEMLAIESWDGKLAYGELRSLSSSLSAYLLSLGVAKGIMVAVCLEKSKWTIVAMLAILKAGAVCVPMDPKYPMGRLKTIMRNTKAKFILTSHGNEKFQLEEGFQNVCVGPALIETLPINNQLLDLYCQSTDAAFVIYTSGSTGNPKGIVLEHGSLCTGAAAHGAIMKLDETSRVLQFASYAFDISICEIFTTLVHGGCVCVPSESERLNDLSAAIARLGVTHLCLTATVAKLLHPTDIPSVKTLSVSGEPMSREIISTWAPFVQLTNMYGPAECTIWCTARDCVEYGSDPQNTGRPLRSAIWITDIENNETLLPIGAVGELLIGGPLIARGYLESETQTHNGFIGPPQWLHKSFSSSVPYLYATGDLGYYNNDGTICIVGRKDHQVKINGQRVELGDITTWVQEHMGKVVDVAIEMVPAHNAKDKSVLTCFLALREGTADDEVTAVKLKEPEEEIKFLINTVQRSLSDHLPFHMIPSIFIPINHLPLNNSGKLDHSKLKELGSKLSIKEISFLLGENKTVPITNEHEKQLRSIWSTILQIEEKTIIPTDSFLALGGDSLSAIVMVSKLREKGLHITVTDILSNVRLQDMAACMTETAQYGSIAPPAPFALLPQSGGELLRDEVADLCDLSSDDIEDVYPCTPLQEGLMALSAKHPGTYMAHFVYVLPSHFDIDRFQAAWNSLVQRHAIFRTRIIQTGNAGTVQAVVRCLPSWLGASSERDFVDVDSQDAMLPGQPLIRLRLSILEGKAYFALTIHHALYDGNSMSRMWEELGHRFTGAQHSDTVPFNAFIGYVVSRSADEQKTFWKRQLHGAEPLSFPRLPSPAYAPLANSRLVFASPAPTHSLSDVTMPTILQAAWALLLGQHAGSDDVVFGLTLSGRNAPVAGIDRIVGPTLATVPVRAQISPVQTVTNLLKTLQKQVVDRIPFEQIGLQYIRRISPEIQAACEFQTLLVIQPFEDRGPDGPFEGFRLLPTAGKGFLPHALVLECILSKSHVTFRASFDSAVLEADQVQRMLWQLDHLLGQLCTAAGDTAVGDIDMVCPQDKQLIAEWNRSPPTAYEATLHSLVEEQARQRPDAPAICSWDGDFTYQELDDLTSRLAHFLLRAGATPSRPIPIFMEKSIWTVTAILAVLKFDGTCVMLDPSAPVNRTMNILRTLSADIIICSASSTHHIIEQTDVPQTIAVGPHLRATLHSEPMGPFPFISPKSAAFIVFTSGSTGIPKGIVLTHGGLSSSILHHGPVLRRGSDSRVLQFAAYTFDVSISEIFATLAFGGCVCIPSDNERLNSLSSAIQRMSVTQACLTPSVAAILRPRDVPSLQSLAVTGECLTSDVINIWADKVQLLNLYGPAECSIWTTCNPTVSILTDPSNIGRGIGTRTWVANLLNLDALAPIGAVGELVLQGPLVSDGYWNDPEKTNISFVQNASWQTLPGFLPDPGNRLYRTGDLVRYNANGTIVFIGRRDSQIKIHGQRIDLSEIEQHLRKSNEELCFAVVIPRKGYMNQHLLAVFATHQMTTVGDEDFFQFEPSLLHTVDIENIQLSLSQYLPSHMIPQVWLAINALPLSLSGKLDRRSLLRWSENVTEQHAANFQDLRLGIHVSSDSNLSDAQVLIRGVWSRALNVPPESIALTDSILRLGGDSISAMRIVAQCRALGYSVTVQELLQGSSVFDISRFEQPEVLYAKNEVPIQDNECFPLSPIQSMFFNYMPQGNNTFDQCFVFQLKPGISDDKLSEAFSVITQRHDMLKARFVMNGGRWVQYIDQDASWSPLTCQMCADEVEATIAMARVRNSLNIQKGPVFAYALFSIEGVKILFLTAHHLVIDLVSWRIIMGELEQILQSGSAEQSPSTPYSSWCRAQFRRYQENHITTPRLSQVPSPDWMQYWGIDVKDNRSHDSMTQSFTLSKADSDVLLHPSKFSLQAASTDIFLASLFHSFRDVFMNRESPVIFAENHGRMAWKDSPDLSQTVGWFTTIYPVLMQNSYEDIFDLISKVKNDHSKAQDHGWDYFASRTLQDKDKFFSAATPIEILLNFHGKYQQFEHDDAVFRRATMQNNLLHFHSDVKRFAIFDIAVTADDNFVTVFFTFSRHLLYRDLILKWMKHCEESMVKVATKLRSSNPRSVDVNFYSQDPQNLMPCSPMQQIMLQSRSFSANTYRPCAIYEVSMKDPTEHIDILRFKEAWKTVVKRHSILQTTFVEPKEPGGLYHQYINQEYYPSVDHIECSCSEPSLACLPQESAPLTYLHPGNVFLCTHSGNRLFCFFILNHAVIDGHSLEVVVHDLASAYENDLGQKRFSGYGDFIQYLNKRETGPSLEYWSSYMKGYVPFHFHLQSSSSTRKKAFRSTELHFITLNQILNFCSRIEVTLSSVLRAAWAVLLKLLGQRSDTCFGYFASGRDIDLAEIDGIVGPVFSILPCRIYVTDTETLLDIIRKTHDDSIKNIPHQNVSYPEVQLLHGQTPKFPFNTVLNFRKFDIGNDRQSKILELTPVGGSDPMEFDIAVEIGQIDSSIEFRLSYWEPTVENSFATQIADHFEGIILAMLKNEWAVIGSFNS